MTDKQLQGEWIGSVTGSDEAARMVLGPHPEWDGNVKGSINRPGSSYPMVGDLNQGTVTLEESADGSRITGTWLGEVVEGSCGTEIHGSYLEEKMFHRAPSSCARPSLELGCVLLFASPPVH